MRILITGANSRLGAVLAKALSPSHDVRTTGVEGTGRSSGLSYLGDARDRAFAARVAGDCDAIIHLPLVTDPLASDLDALDVATRATYNLLTTASQATRFILISTLRHFDRYPAQWRVTERWAPRPTTDVDNLAPYLAELTVREAARVLPLKGIALRLGEVVGDESIRGKPADPRWVHIDDAVQAVQRALVFEPGADTPPTGWWVFHIVGAGADTRFPLAEAGRPIFGYSPCHDLATGAPIPDVQEETPRPHSPSGGKARHVLIYGAGGPLGAATAEVLASDHVMRLTDVRPLADIAAQNWPRQPGGPVPRLFGAPHEAQVVDITDADQVLRATQGMDAIVNCSVIRNDPVQAFRVNTLGCYNVMTAAVACGVRRIIHTGPTQLFQPGPAGYLYDFNLCDDIPRRPGTELYYISKFLGQEICRVFADAHDLEVPCLLFGTFLDPTGTPSEPHGAYPFAIAWPDAADAMRRALEAPGYPRPFEVLHITGDLPHGMYSNEKAKHLLNWQPRDRLAAHWHRRP